MAARRGFTVHDVEAEEARLASGGFDLGLHGLGRGVVAAIVQQDRVTRRREDLADRRADPAAATGDKRPIALVLSRGHGLEFFLRAHPWQPAGRHERTLIGNGGRGQPGSTGESVVEDAPLASKGLEGGERLPDHSPPVTHRNLLPITIRGEEGLLESPLRSEMAPASRLRIVMSTVLPRAWR